MAVLTPGDVRPRLNKTSTVDDTEISDLIDSAEAEFTELVGPLVPTVFTERHRGPLIILRRRPVVGVRLVAGPGDAALPWAIDEEVGLLTVGAAGHCTVTYEAGYLELPGNIRELIIADVAGYFARTQRGGGFPGDQFAEPVPASSPVTMWPRIANYARRHSPGLA